ncbi:MAG: J domain-containing protein [Myxococcales bacterium]|nr:J domain-containing protein [Myxococcales bacterium]
MSDTENPIRDPYATLELKPGATADEVKQAYRRLAKLFHPDRNPDNPEAEERFKAVAAAFEILSDPTRRAEHDRRHGSTSPAGLPEAFVDDVSNSIERAQTYIERMVLPHYARYASGVNAEAAARMLQDLTALADVSHAMGWDKPSLVHRWRAARWARRIGVSLESFPAATISMLVQGRAGSTVIVLTPFAMHRAGFRQPTDIDDAVLRVLLARYAQILAAGHIAPPDTDDGWPETLAAAQALDRAHRSQQWGQRAFYAVVVGVAALLIYAGYAGW